MPVLFNEINYVKEICALKGIEVVGKSIFYCTYISSLFGKDYVFLLTDGEKCKILDFVRIEDALDLKLLLSAKNIGIDLSSVLSDS